MKESNLPPFKPILPGWAAYLLQAEGLWLGVIVVCLILGIWAGAVHLDAPEESHAVLGFIAGVAASKVLRPVVRLLLKGATSLTLKKYRPHPMSTYFGPSA